MAAGSATSGDSAPLDLGPWVLVALTLPAACSAIAWTWPRAAVVAAPVLVLACFATLTPAFTVAFAMAVPLYVAGLRGHLRWGVASIVGTTSLTALYRLLLEHDGGSRWAALLDVVRDAALLAVLVLLGDAVRFRAAARREATLEREVREAEHARRLAEQRLTTARELHDVLAHTLTLAGIQANVAADTFDRDPAAARTAVQRLRSTAADAMADLRSTIALLRTPLPATAAAAPTPGLAGIAELVEGARGSGLDVTLESTGPLDRVRPAIGLAGYRVVQEALTNTLRHADARRAAVVVAVDGAGTTVTVTDDGTAAAGPAGFGLTGMAERVRALSGSLSHGPDAGGGFVVTARFPAGDAP